MDVFENSGTPKSSILIGFSIINHPFWGTPIFGNPHINMGRILTPFITTWGLNDAHRCGFYLHKITRFFGVGFLLKISPILPDI